MNEKQRKDWILEQINHKGQVLVSEIIENLKVSAVTARAYLKQLENNGSISRFHGGACLPEKKKKDHPLSLNESKNKDKEIIANKALSFVKDNSTIIIGSGTTTAIFAEKLSKSNKKDLTIVTNNILAIPYLIENENFNIIVIGGSYQKNNHSTFTHTLSEAIKRLTIDQMFTGADGYDDHITTSKNSHNSMSSELAKFVKEIYVLAESYKKGKVFFNPVLSIDMVSQIITEK